MTDFITSSLLITDYYDSLISQLDIYTEERTIEIKEKGLPTKKTNQIYVKPYFDTPTNKFESCEEYNNPYENQMFTIYRTNDSDIEIIENISQAEEYMIKLRQNAIDEITKVQDENLKYYKANKEKFKVDRENLTEEKLEELKSQLFANRFCFLVNKKPTKYCFARDGEPYRYIPIFNMHTVITDFYLSKSEIDFIKIGIEDNYQLKHPKTESPKLDQRYFLVNQIKKYIKETLLDKYLNGFEIIRINQKTLFEIGHIEVSSNFNRFNETNLSFDTDLSAIKSLSLNVAYARIVDLSAFVNLEYLYISGIKLCEWPFKNLKKLIKIKIFNCNLENFDFDSLNSLTSLRIVEINSSYFHKNNQPMSIDLNRLINLKWIDLDFIKRDKIILELITDSNYNQLTKVKVNSIMIDFSKQLYWPELKYLDISNVDLSQQISDQWFHGMTSLIELILNNTNLTNVDFFDTDRLGNLEILDLSRNQIKVLRKEAFSKLKKLKRLNLLNNLIEELAPGVFEGLECLKHLNISFNHFCVESIDQKVLDKLNSWTILRKY